LWKKSPKKEKKMTKNHLKRLNAPKTWGIKRKESRFVTRPKPGPHSFKEGISLNLILKELLNYADTTKDVKRILSNKDVLVDGKPRKDHRFLAGLMDIISLPKKKEYFKILLNKKGKLELNPIKENYTGLKFCKIKEKSFVGKKVQLNLHDGRNILVDKDSYKVGDTLVLEVPKQKIKEHLKLEQKSFVYLIGGRHIGETGIIEDIKGKNIVYKKDSGEVYETLKRYAFVIEKTKPITQTKSENKLK